MKHGILLVAFGSGNLRGTATLRSVQATAEERFGLPVRWAFTSELVRHRLARSRTKSDSVLKALNRMRFERYTHIAVQSLHLLPGLEYCSVAEACAAAMKEGPLTISLGQPLLATPESIHAAAHALIKHLSPLRNPDEPVVCMAHGSRHDSESQYLLWNECVQKLDPMVHIACMKGMLPLDTLLPRLAEQAPPSRRVWLLPLLSLVGRHTLEDMAGASPESWKSRIEAAGFCCLPELRGLADDPAFIDIWMHSLEAALSTLSPAQEGRPASPLP